MKILLSLSLALITLAPAQAQMFRPEAGDRRSPRENSGSGSHRRIDHGSRDRTTVHVGIGHGHHHGNSHRYGTGWHAGWGPRYSGSPYRYVPSYGYYDGYGYGYPYYGTTGYYGSGNAATNGLLLGALAGGIIGHNSGTFHHNGWRGAAWGAGAGWLLGTIADANRRTVVYDRAPAVMSPSSAVQVQAQPAAQPPQQVTIINNYYNSSAPMSGANSLFGR